MSKKELINDYELSTEKYNEILGNLKNLIEDKQIGFAFTKAMAFENLISKAQDNNFRIPDGRYEVLKSYKLIEDSGNISEDVKNVVIDTIISPLGELHSEY